MRLNKTAQYALLFTMYLLRSGLATTKDISANLGISHQFVEQIARKLRVAGIVTVRRGPGGGYEIRQGFNPSAAEVLRAVGVTGLLSSRDTAANAVRGTEGRTLNHLIGMASIELNSVLNQSLTTIASSLVTQEVAQLNSIADNATVS